MDVKQFLLISVVVVVAVVAIAAVWKWDPKWPGIIGLATTHDESKLEAGKKAASHKSSRNRIIPPPLKDLKKDYKVRLVYFVPSDREAKPKPWLMHESCHSRSLLNEIHDA